MKALVFISIFVFSFSAYTQSSSDEMSRLNAEKIELSNKIKNLEGVIENLNSQLDKVVQTIKDNPSDDGPKGRQRDNAERRYRSKLYQVNHESEDLKKKLTQLEKKIDKKRTKIQADKTQKTVEKMEALLEVNGLNIDTAKLFNRNTNIDLELNKLESTLDKSVYGMYVQDKVGQLLNSQVICAARKRCLTSGKDEIPSSVIQKELFPDSINTRSEYYDKVNYKSSKGTQ